jgi:hypothetical protein
MTYMCICLFVSCWCIFNWIIIFFIVLDIGSIFCSFNILSLSGLLTNKFFYVCLSCVRCIYFVNVALNWLHMQNYQFCCFKSQMNKWLVKQSFFYETWSFCINFSCFLFVLLQIQVFTFLLFMLMIMILSWVFNGWWRFYCMFWKVAVIISYSFGGNLFFTAYDLVWFWNKLPQLAVFISSTVRLQNGECF